MSDEVIFKVTGMTCGACTASVTESLNKLTGVKEASVSLITEEAKVLFDVFVVKEEELVLAIEDCGFDCSRVSINLATVETSLSITGMTCAACSTSVTNALLQLPGVKKASISVMTDGGIVTHLSSVKISDIKTAVEDCGFDVSIGESKTISRSNVNNSPSTIRTIFSVSGMTCGACTSSVTGALESLNGIEKVSVSLITEEASVIHSDEVSVDQIKEAIEDCGFDATLKTSEFIGGNIEVHEDETLSLQIFGISESTDITAFQYNMEAFLNSQGGVTDYKLSLVDPALDQNLSTAARSDSIRASRSLNSSENQLNENVIDELQVTYNPDQVGIRDLVDGINNIDSSISFLVVNSLDQSSTAQLNLLSRVKDIQYWKSVVMKALFLGIPVIILSKTQHLSIWKKTMLFPGCFLVSIIELALATYIQFHLGATFLKKFYQFIKMRGKGATMDVLVCISTLLSYIFSVCSIVLSVWNGLTNAPPNASFDTVAMLILFISFGKYLENRAKGATSTALSKLLSLTPSSCTIVSDLEAYEKKLLNKTNLEREEIQDVATRDISIDLIQKGDIAVVLPGGKIPADGTVVYGETEIDESFISGESRPVYKKKDDEVLGGSINGPDLIYVRVLRSGKDSMLQKVISLVKDSQINKAPVQRFSDYLAAKFVPLVILISIFTFVTWMIICSRSQSLPNVFLEEKNGKVYVCFKLAISVIVVACPCALGLAAPTAIMVGTGMGASNGVLIKGGEVLEKSSKVNILLFDKTGTLTTGKMTVVNYSNTLKSTSEDEWWQLVGAVENNSEHPVGRAITGKARLQLNLTLEDIFNSSISEFKVLPGLGIRAIVRLANDKQHQVVIGNAELMARNYNEVMREFNKLYSKDLQDSIYTIAHVIIDDEYAGYIELSDYLKPHTKDVINYLRYNQKYLVGMVTGDNSKAAKAIGKELGLDEENIFSEVSAVDKDKVIIDLKKKFGGDENATIAFVGDGINDAPALAQADIGIAISTGSDIAIESADIVIIDNKKDSSDLSGVPIALDISNRTFSKIKMNFVWAAIYNIIMLPFAMGCFLSMNIMLPPAAAGASMALSSVTVVISSLLLKKWKPKKIVGSNLIDLEKGDISTFSLKHSSLAEFNDIKRNNSVSSRVLRIFSRTNRRNNSNEYELLSYN